MKNKIFKLAKGEFLTDDPEVILGASRITFHVGEGDVYEGCLTLKDSHGGPVRGLVYTSLMRLKLKTQGFDSVSPEIAFSFDARGLKPGRSVTGQITVVTNGGEYSLPVTAVIEKPYVMSSIGKIQNLDAFAYLAYKNFAEAHEIFKGREMRRIIRYEAPFVRALYEKMRTWSLSEPALEEFLVATKKKERLNITLSDDNKVYDSVPETDEVILFKNDWGSLSVSVSAEGDFIVPEKTSYGREDFCGNTLRIGYRIDETKLHAGKNFGRIRVRTFYEEKTLSLCVKNGGKRGAHPVEKTMAELSLGRIRVEAGEMTEIEFYEKAERQLKELKNRVPEKRMTELYLAELYLDAGKRLDAAEIVDHLIWRREELKREPLLGLYQSYLRYKLDGEDRQREKLIGILKKHLKKDPQNETVSLWLLEVDPAYEDTEKRAGFLKILGDGGAHSAKFLFEAWRTYEENPELLKVLGPFEKRVLRFAVHYHLGGPFFLAQAVYLGSRKTTYDPGLTRTLKALFDLAEPGLKGEILPVITSQFIKGNVISPWAHAFYSASIKNGHMITRLYEFFMMTLPDNAIDEKLPREVYINFAYGGGEALPESKKALLYASALRYLPMGDAMRENYKDRIRRFAEEQLHQRRISEALRVIYRNVLPEVELNMTELKALRDICHVYEVSTSMPGMKYILVLDKDGEITEKVPVKAGGRSQVVLRDPESRIVWEGTNGWHYADSFAYDMVRMFYETAFIDRVRVVEREEKEEEKVLPLTRKDILKEGLEAFSKRALFAFFEDEEILGDDREDTLLLSLAAHLYQSGVRSDKLVAYLGKWYTGPTEDMVRVWKDTKERGFESRTLAEKIITQMLFSGQLVAEEAIFEDYYNGETLVAIKRAYLVKKGAEYLTRDAVTTEGYFEILKKEMEGKQPLPMVCRLAYLKHASSGQMAEEGLRDIFKDAILEGIMFPFFMDCPAEWLREMGISDKVILLYRGQTGEEVSVYTAVTKEDGEPEVFEREVLSPMWMNQYVGAFTVYAGEKLTWYFEEGDHKTQIRSLIKRQGSGCGRYSALSRILAADREERDHLVMDYYTEERLAEHFFGDEMVEEVWNR